MPHIDIEGSSVVITLVWLGKWMEICDKRQTTEVVLALNALRPSSALVHQASVDREVPAAQLQVGNVVVVQTVNACPWMTRRWKAAATSTNHSSRMNGLRWPNMSATR